MSHKLEEYMFNRRAICYSRGIWVCHKLEEESYIAYRSQLEGLHAIVEAYGCDINRKSTCLIEGLYAIAEAYGCAISWKRRAT